MTISTKSHLKSSVPTRRQYRTFGGAQWAIGVTIGLITVHYIGLALLNYTSAQQQALHTQIAHLREQNEALRLQLNLAGDDPTIRRWAEHIGMVRVEEHPSTIIMGVPPGDAHPILRQSMR